jgi:hypothetical protein
MKSFDRRTWAETLTQLDAWGWVEMVPGPRPTSPPQGIVNPMVHSKYAKRAEEEVARRKLSREILVNLGVAGGN